MLPTVRFCIIASAKWFSKMSIINWNIYTNRFKIFQHIALMIWWFSVEESNGYERYSGNGESAYQTRSNARELSVFYGYWFKNSNFSARPELARRPVIAPEFPTKGFDFLTKGIKSFKCLLLFSVVFVLSSRVYSILSEWDTPNAFRLHVHKSNWLSD